VSGVVVRLDGVEADLSELSVVGRRVFLVGDSSRVYGNVSVGVDKAVGGGVSNVSCVSSRGIGCVLESFNGSGSVFLLDSPVEMVQGSAVLGVPVNWTLRVGGYVVSYETAPPVREESPVQVSGGVFRKNVSVESNASVHYCNVSAYSDLEAPATGVRLYLLLDGSKTDVTDDPAYRVRPEDANGDGLYERIHWIIPQLSKKKFLIEADIVVLDVQSYPVVGGNWTVRFNTTGTANLTIKAVDGTTWSNTDDSSDLRFLELRCGGQVVDYSWVNGSVYVPDYTCNETGYEVSRVLSSGHHHLMFVYGGVVAYADNWATDFRTWPYRQNISLYNGGSVKTNYAVRLDLNASRLGRISTGAVMEATCVSVIITLRAVLSRCCSIGWSRGIRRRTARLYGSMSLTWVLWRIRRCICIMAMPAQRL